MFMCVHIYYMYSHNDMQKSSLVCIYITTETRLKTHLKAISVFHKSLKTNEMNEKCTLKYSYTPQENKKRHYI